MTGFRCLAIETATEQAGVALVDGDRLFLREEHGLRAPSRCVYQWIDDLLRQAGLTLGELDCIAFGAGPGSFTGLRVAAAVAQSIAFARGLPICRVSTLAALALAGCRQSPAGIVAAALDARMGQVYLGVYRCVAEAGVVAIVDDALLSPDAWKAALPPRTRAVGPGWAAYPALMEAAGAQVVAVDNGLLPSAREVAALARPQFEAGLTVAPNEALPNYLRERVTS